jgi:hypothetical protein
MLLSKIIVCQLFRSIAPDIAPDSLLPPPEESRGALDGAPRGMDHLHRSSETGRIARPAPDSLGAPLGIDSAMDSAVNAADIGGIVSLPRGLIHPASTQEDSSEFGPLGFEQSALHLV